MKRETIGDYELETKMLNNYKWVYRIFSSHSKETALIVSDDYFDSEGRARFAAIGHISLLEKGESHG